METDNQTTGFCFETYVRFPKSRTLTLSVRDEGDFRLSAVAMSRNKGRWEWKGACFRHGLRNDPMR